MSCRVTQIHFRLVGKTPRGNRSGNGKYFKWKGCLNLRHISIFVFLPYIDHPRLPVGAAAMSRNAHLKLLQLTFRVKHLATNWWCRLIIADLAADYRLLLRESLYIDYCISHWEGMRRIASCHCGMGSCDLRRVHVSMENPKVKWPIASSLPAIPCLSSTSPSASQMALASIVYHALLLRFTSISGTSISRTIRSAPAWRLCVGTVDCISKERLSGAWEVKATPVDVSEAGTVERMPV